MTDAWMMENRRLRMLLDWEIRNNRRMCDLLWELAEYMTPRQRAIWRGHGSHDEADSDGD
jgi:hypothetical protein